MNKKISTVILLVGILIATAITYQSLSYKYIVYQNGCMYTGRCLVGKNGVTVFTEDGGLVVLYQVVGPIEIKLKEDQ